jgi:hypothetical protein
MTIALSTLRTEVRESLAVDATDMPDATIDLLLNRTYWELLEKFHIRETESSTTLTTNQGQREYLLPPDFESLRISAIIDPETNQHHKLSMFSVKEYEALQNDDVENEEFPTHYFRANESLILWPTPDDTYTVILHYRQTLADLSDAAPSAALPKSWQELLIFGAVFRGWFKLNDYDRANSAKAHYIGMINSMVPQESKEESDTSTAGLQVLGREY